MIRANSTGDKGIYVYACEDETKVARAQSPSQFCTQLTKAYVAKTSCNQLLLIDSTMYVYAHQDKLIVILTLAAMFISSCSAPSLRPLSKYLCIQCKYPLLRLFTLH